jgi:hypothetical protein
MKRIKIELEIDADGFDPKDLAEEVMDCVTNYAEHCENYFRVISSVPIAVEVSDERGD